MHTTLTSVLTLTLALAAGACGKTDDACATLASQIATSTGAPTARVATLIDRELTGPSGDALEGDQRDAACKMIVSDKDALEGYTGSIKSQLAQ